MIRKRFLILPIALLAQPSVAQSVDDAINAALLSEPGYLAAKLGEAVQNAKLKAAKADNKPTIGLQGSAGASNANFGMGYKEIYPRNLAIAWEKRIYDGGEALARIKSEEFALASANAEKEIAKNQLVAQTAEAYYNLYSAKKSMDFAQDNIAANQRYARDAALSYKAGEVAISEKAFADAALARAEALKAQTQGDIEMASANLYRLTNFEVANPTLSGAPQIPASLKEAIEQAKLNHPILLSFKAKLGQAEAQYKLSKAAFAPKVSVSARATTTRDMFLSGYKADDVGAYVNVSVPLYTYGRGDANQEAARNGRDQARLALLGAERNLEMQIRQGYSALDMALAQRQAAMAGLNASQIALNSVEAEMRVGQRPMKDVLDARRDLTLAQTEVAKADAAIMIAKYKIQAAVGR